MLTTGEAKAVHCLSSEDASMIPPLSTPPDFIFRSHPDGLGRNDFNEIKLRGIQR